MTVSTSNTLLTNDIITNETLLILRNKFVFVPRCMQTVDNLFGQAGHKNGSTIRVRIPVRYVSAVGAGIYTNNSVESQTSITLIQRNIGMGFTTADMTLSIDDFRHRFIETAVAQLATDIDQDGFAVADKAQNLSTPGAIVGGYVADFTGADLGGTTAATALRPFLDAKARLTEQAAPPGERYVSISPAASAGVISNLSGLFQSATEIAEQYKTGLMGLTAGFEWVESAVMGTHTNGTRLDTGNVTLSANATSGSFSLSSSSLDSGTINAGDMYQVAGVYSINPLTRLATKVLQVFTVTTATSFSANAATVTATPVISVTAPDQTVSAIGLSGAAVHWVGAAGVVTDKNLAWNKNAFLVAFCDLETDLPGAESHISRDPESKISVRLVRQYNSETDLLVSRLDVLYGFACVRPPLAVKIYG